MGAQHFGCVPFRATALYTGPHVHSATLHAFTHIQNYSEFRLPAYPHLTAAIDHYSTSKQDPTTSVGAYWQQPGRSILRNHLVEVPEPKREMFEPLERVYFTGEHLLVYIGRMARHNAARWSKHRTIILRGVHTIR